MSAFEHLPLVTSIEETYRDWNTLNSTQKIGAVTALIVTTTRPILRALQESKRQNNHMISTTELLMSIGLDLSDALDGTIARSAGGVTALGKELDPLMDKIDFAIQEAAQYRRGTLPLGHVAARLARDIIVTLVRSYVHTATNGEVDISAGWQGKASTFARLVSLRITSLPGERDHPRVRKTHQTIATGLIVGSGAISVKKLLDAKAEYDRNNTLLT